MPLRNMYTLEIHFRNTVSKYSFDIHFRNTLENTVKIYTLEIHIRNTVEIQLISTVQKLS